VLDPPASSHKHQYCPAEYISRIHAVTDLIRWGPSTFSHAEFLVLLFFAERTISYGKRADSTSLAQITVGIYSRRNGEWIRGGAGIRETAVKAATKALSQRGFLICRHALPGETRYRAERGNEPTEYEINWTALFDEFAKRKRAPLSRQVTKPLSRLATKPLGRAVPHNRSKSSSREKGIRGSSSRERDGSRVQPRTAEHDGDDESPEKPFTSPKVELDHLISQRGGLLSEFEWWRLNEALELRKIELADFIEFVRPHLLNPKTTNPLGMIKSKIKHYAAMNRPALTQVHKTFHEVVTAEKCPICHELKGKGTIIDGNHLVACECATEEWRAKLEQQERERMRRADHKDQRNL
jgi:hypothetical protein